MQGQVDPGLVLNINTENTRLYYIDWLRILAIFGVFLFHSSSVFNTLDFHIKNVGQSEMITIIQAFFFPWGMPLFFTIAGTGTWFALRRRSAMEYIKERTNRLLLPFIIGSLLLSPVQFYFEWSHKVQTNVFEGTFIQFLTSLPWEPNSRIFAAVGYHMWFLGFLFLFSMLGLPIFRSFRSDLGRNIISKLIAVSRYRGGLIVFAFLPIIARLSLQPVFPYEHDWADFFYLLTFFINGYLVISDERLRMVIKRDWWISLGIGILAFLGAFFISFSTGELDIEAIPRSSLEFIWWGLFALCGWCWTVFVLSIGMRYLNFSNRLLQYGQEAIVPFFVVHQPVIIVISFFVVQWDTSLLLKLIIVVLGSFLLSIGFYQFVVKRIGIMSLAFGVKTRHLKVTPESMSWC
ncbi:MAG: acyltransferase [Dehalococcoidales bacterium]|nr:MAG: acyltransferase [Dehalococcoidales bacterium]